MPTKWLPGDLCLTCLDRRDVHLFVRGKPRGKCLYAFCTMKCEAFRAIPRGVVVLGLHRRNMKVVKMPPPRGGGPPAPPGEGRGA